MQYPLPDRFEVLEERERTGSKVLLRAWDRRLEREVVVQLLGAAARRRVNEPQLLREARMMARVQHPGVCRLLDVLETEAGPALVLDPLAGETLAERLVVTPRLQPAEVQRLGRAVAEAAAAVHASGVVHRGIAENNILFQSDGSIVLTGFEFSKPLEGIGHNTSLDFRGATRDALPAYPAPEQLKGEKASVRTDVFSLGCVLYRALTGQMAIRERGALIDWTTPEDPAYFVPDAPADLLEVIRKCLQESPLKRYPSMRDVVVALSPRAREASRAAGPVRFWRRTVVAASAAVLVVVAVLGVAARQWLRLGSEDTSPARGRLLLDPPQDTSAFHDRYDASHALLIGVDYDDNAAFRRLPNAVRDVTSIAERLRALGWSDVKLLTGREATHDRIERELEDLEMRAGKNDQVFIYFAGHGEIPKLEEGVATRTGFAIPADAGKRPEGSWRKGHRWLEFSRFDSFFDESDVKHILIALDCCHSSAGWDEPRGAPQADARYASRFLAQRAHVLLASSRANESAWDGEGRHSPFATAFLASLDQAAAGEPITTTRLWATVQDSLRADDKGQISQMFWRRGASSQFVFLPAAR